MVAWGTAAWDNDGAADWFGDMFEKTKLAKYVEKTLKRILKKSQRRFELRLT
jgi:hypothetical protein